MKLSAKIFAKVGQERITQYTLVNDHHMTLRFLTFGARVQQVRLPNATGFDPNLLLGFVTLEDYLHQPGFFGAMTGPLQPTETNVSGAWQNWNWAVKTSQDPDLVITFSLDLPEGADGQPGSRQLTITHRLNNANIWTIDMAIQTSASIRMHPRLVLPWLLTADPAQTMMQAKLTIATQPTAVPKQPKVYPAHEYSMAAADWQLHYVTDTPATRIDPFADIGTQNNFNGILGQPHVAIGIAPEANSHAQAWELPAGETWRHHAEYHLGIRHES
ncbi:aldose epimerase [Lacticaseibacillus chiayiensis]|uniref:Aldose epimerase n=1 Tax=Lacticaseibacillus chiayiensis TaxID=2100821 RepID=A0A4Q1UCD3_9LACO|nr:aldose epimerase [Lacticaseibacillus chiayiensis]QVI33754.1 aldose epimerase [Lacticaseibacillus chiayiensis]RXT29689.1 aldose epimerase [Lacticaseibacillus chiayiensis]UYN55499.1 aldose epimerase [Lacticaseibacillus chiayiensis]